MSRRVPRLSGAELVDRYVNQGQSQARIAADVGVDRSTVGAWLRGAGIPTRRCGARPVVSVERRRERLAVAYTEGASLHALAAEYQLSHTTVWRYLLAAGVTLRPAGGSSPQLSAEWRERLAAAYTRGASIRALAGEHGIGRATVCRYLVAAGVTVRPASGDSPRLSAERRERLTAAYTRGASIRALAREHHLSYGTVRTHLLAAGVTLRSRSGIHRRVGGGGVRS